VVEDQGQRDAGQEEEFNPGANVIIIILAIFGE
jgi:hypothetical protein